MQVHVEFYGIARARAGAATALAEGETLGMVLQDLAHRFPMFAETCVAGDGLRPGFAANIDGARFVQAPETPLREGETLLILSADAGG